MKFPWTLVVLMLVSMTALANNTTLNTHSSALWSSSTEAQVKERLHQMDLPLEVVSNQQVMTKIRQYVTAGKRDTELILGRTFVYFPIFEHYLKQYNLPEELKFLPMIESGLRPNVKSGVGATGLWQLMSITARYNGLTVDGQVDQRLDPYASTEAAVKMLDFLYKQFGDWGLVLAAYNSGHGRVKKAMKLAGSNDYWTVKAYLPVETQKYVPAFIAAAYIANHYNVHQLSPNITTDLNQVQDTRLIKVKEAISFKQIAQATGLSYALVAKLNRAYVAGYVPANAKGHNLVLPTSATSSLRHYLQNKGKLAVPAKSGQVGTIYVVSKGDNLAKIAKLFNTDVASIMQWNDLSENTVTINQELVLYMSRAYLMKRA
ncbi:MAG TPA: transglycosylase SLT domain-containing protein [Saprospiraceae bacterium]|nr:transglycosylase SLT domain-containing protein [Saprospiraceae bacterium]